MAIFHQYRIRQEDQKPFTQWLLQVFGPQPQGARDAYDAQQVGTSRKKPYLSLTIETQHAELWNIY